MNSRDRILQATAENQPAQRDLPVIDFERLIRYDEPAVVFEQVLTKIGGQLVRVKNLEEVKNRFGEEDQEKFCVDVIDCTEEDRLKIKAWKATDLALLHTLYIKGSFGVAENSAVWVDELAMVNRLLPFICEHLFIVLEEKEIVPTMHHAYQKTDVNRTGFGSFIAGPSKTADIEQSLVIGAHGPRSLTIYLIEKDSL
ncbi:LUD domain-containing protein [Pedobacter sp. HMWF019]|uniref:LutC/YkgG family protein n=1 Tax=Pedobacter sp. HMWF019 TaxID=2056856 RepID=UPI001304948F|nr:LUD domain-containing protein [Pedobacter sp. HMWF019]